MKSTQSENILGIDIGTNYIRACLHNDELLDFIKVPSVGVQAGNIINKDDFSISLLKLINKVKKNYNIKKVKLIIGLASSTMNSGNLNISIPINNNNSKVSDIELNAIIEKNESIYDNHHLTTLYHKVKKYRLNGIEQKTLPLGMMGTRLDAKIFSIFVDKNQVLIIEDICKKLKLEIGDILASPLLEAELILSNKQKLSGVALLHIGYANSSLVVYENYEILAVGSLPFGTQNLDNEIALGLKVSLEDAYSIRLGHLRTGYNKKKLEEIIEVILNSWTTKINEELDIIKRKELLPSGILILGEICNMIKFESIFKNNMKLPIKLEPKILSELKDFNIQGSEWLRALALSIADIENRAEIKKIWKQFYNHIKQILCQFLP